MAKKKARSEKQTRPVNTGGGAYVGGSVHTGGGDFVGRDKNVSADRGGVAVGGDAADNTLTTGSGNLVAHAKSVFAPVYRAIKQSDRSEQQKADLAANVGEIQAEAAKGNQADESFLARRLRNLRSMAPDIAEVALAALSGPGAALGAVVRKVAEKVKGEAGSTKGE